MTITAKIIADSVNDTNGIRITTFELEYPRFIHAEFMTHRMFSRNAASSRAIPVKRAIELVRENTARPVHWGKNQPGMSAKEECNGGVSNVGDVFNPVGLDTTRDGAWDIARDNAIQVAERFDAAGYHKQIVNRLIEPFTHIKVVCTATDYNNFFGLRCHPDAQPEIQELAQKMWEEYSRSNPTRLLSGDWHVPYFRNGYWAADMEESKEDALAISASCCAQVSYRRLDDSLEKARDIYKRLVESKPMHASPFEHQATPIDYETTRYDFVGDNDRVEPFAIPGVTHISGHPYLGMVDIWSGNFRGWVQHRHLIPGNTIRSYDGGKYD